MIRVMDLFSGVGGFSLGLRRAGGFRTDAYCEIEPECQRILLARMRDGSLDTAPICRDVTRLVGTPWRARIDLICGGFPCQDISNAGNSQERRGLDGERSGLWFHMLRLVREIRPRIVFVENTPALLGRGIDRVLGGLAESGYDAEWSVVSACSVGAPHMRKRLFIVAHSHLQRLEGGIFEGEQVRVETLPSAEIWRELPGPYVRPAPYGVSERMVEIGAFGNAVVPQVIEWIGRRILRASA